MFFFCSRLIWFDLITSICWLCPIFIPFGYMINCEKHNRWKHTRSFNIYLKTWLLKIDNCITYFSIRKGFTTICWMAQPVLTKVILFRLIEMLMNCWLEKTLTKNEKKRTRNVLCAPSFPTLDRFSIRNSTIALQYERYDTAMSDMMMVLNSLKCLCRRSSAYGW